MKQTGRYKYIHLMPMGASSFCVNFILFINKFFPIHEHLFVLMSKNVSEKLAGVDNVVYEDRNRVEVLNEYLPLGDSIILHSLSYSIGTFLFMKRSSLRKMTWWVWGNDLYMTHRIRRDISSLKKRLVYYLKVTLNLFYAPLYDLLWKCLFFSRVKKMNSIVVCCRADQDEVRRRFGPDIKVFRSYYTAGHYYREFVQLEEKRTDNSINILIGHSAFAFLKHKDYLDRLLAYKDEDIKIVLPLTYGDASYADEIENYAKALYGDKALVLREGLDYLDYVKLMKTIDVAIFDYKHQSALGNIMLLLLFGKKVYLSSKGVLFKGFKEDGVNVYDCDEIGKIPLKELSSHPYPNISGKEYAKEAFDEDLLKKNYENIFEYLAK